MTATAKARLTQRKGTHGQLVNLPVKGGVVLYAGTLVVRDANGYLTNPSAATTLKAVGRMPRTVDTTGIADGVVYADVETGTFKWANSAAADEITIADVGKVCYMVDNQTVAKTSDTNTRSEAGVVIAVEADGVFVQTGMGDY